MRTAALSPEESIVITEATAILPVATRTGGEPGPRWLTPVAAMAAGLLVVGLAATVLLSALTRDGGASAPAPLAAAAAADPLAVTLSARDVSVVQQVYEPGQASGWHSHSGIHAVAVLSGVLTVYDGQCHAQTFQAGQPYVGGQELHLVRNESSEPVVMSVTYLNPTSGGEPTRRFPAPSGCAA
jgi:quercetin dioxygenase-like cupin family protein